MCFNYNKMYILTKEIMSTNLYQNLNKRDVHKNLQYFFKLTWKSS